MILEYTPKNADILLWMPVRLYEYTICATLGQPFHHASLVRVTADGKISVLDQNVDFVREDPQDLNLLLGKYKFAVLRAEWLTRTNRKRIVDFFNKMRTAAYSYRGAWKTLFYTRFSETIEEDSETVYFDSAIDPYIIVKKRDTNDVRVVKRYTCVGLVNLCFLRVTKVNLCPNKPAEWVSPIDIYDSKFLTKLGIIGPSTKLVIPTRNKADLAEE